MPGADQPLHMLGYWLEKRGITETLTSYAPYLAKTDPIIGPAWIAYQQAKWIIEQRVKQITEQAQEEQP
jgi:hypothetical protein